MPDKQNERIDNYITGRVTVKTEKKSDIYIPLTVAVLLLLWLQ